jgi:hypothetical protein
VLKLGGANLRRDVFDAALMEQQNGRDDSFRYALSSGPSDIIWMKQNSETIRHSTGSISRQQTRCISDHTKGLCSDLNRASDGPNHPRVRSVTAVSFIEIKIAAAGG